MARDHPVVVIVDDDPAIRLMLRRQLSVLRCQVQDIESRQAAIGFIATEKVDLMIWGVDERHDDAAELVHSVRRRSQVPIIVLSSRDDEDCVVSALESGADDFIRKPFGDRELVARVKNAMRRRAKQQGITTLITTGDLEIDLLRRRVRAGGREVHLPARIYDVLRLLTENAGMPLTHTDILREVWGPTRLDRVQYLRLAIRELRQKLEPEPAQPRYILTEVGVGYRLEICVPKPARASEFSLTGERV